MLNFRKYVLANDFYTELIHTNARSVVLGHGWEYLNLDSSILFLCIFKLHCINPINCPCFVDFNNGLVHTLPHQNVQMIEELMLSL